MLQLHSAQQCNVWKTSIMDNDRFDGLARLLSQGTSRRASLGLLAGVTGLVLGDALGNGNGNGNGKSKKKRKNKKSRALVCHDGQTLVVSSSDVRKHLAHGDSLGPCDVLGASGAATCVPVDQICNPYSPNRCCGATSINATGCYPAAYPFVSVCQMSCSSNEVCHERAGIDTECVTDFGVCPAMGTCCRPRICKGNTDCQGGGPCCPTLLGERRCCAAGQVCATFGGCANP